MPLCPPQLKDSVLTSCLELNFHAFLRAVERLLSAMGYEDVTVLTRTGFVGRNSDGGCDITAFRPVPGGRRAVVVQVKQYGPERAVYRKTLHELQGVVLGRGAAEGLLITTSSFSPSVDAATFASAPVAPLRLIGGAQLADYMALYRVGVSKAAAEPSNLAGQFRLDRSLFAQLERTYTGVARPRPGTKVYAGVLVALTPRKRRP
jgi:restriction endonuclease Mrr